MQRDESLFSPLALAHQQHGRVVAVEDVLALHARDLHAAQAFERRQAQPGFHHGRRLADGLGEIGIRDGSGQAIGEPGHVHQGDGVLLGDALARGPLEERAVRAEVAVARLRRQLPAVEEQVDLLGGRVEHRLRLDELGQPAKVVATHLDGERR